MAGSVNKVTAIQTRGPESDLSEPTATSTAREKQTQGDPWSWSAKPNLGGKLQAQGETVSETTVESG